MISEQDLTQAMIYVEQHGQLQEKARLLYVLAGEKPPREVLQPLLDKQNPDGGFPSRPRGENPSSVDNTITALWQLDELGLLSSPPAERALDFLVQAQQEDGIWDENPDLPVHDLPPWIKPGELATRLYLTAYAAFWLARTGKSPAALQRACRCMSGYLDEEGRLPSYLHANWIAASVFIMTGNQEEANRMLAYLASRPLPDWEDSQLAWALDCLGQAGLALEHPFIASSLRELADRMDPEGSWSSEEGAAYAASATISALKAFKRYRQLPEI